ncbi:MAG: zf-HC2 domain-containing protein [Caldilineales bacterium]|nr:zf-HC2 domain-containing protein [Caldilineales bacterium]MDW8318920.1 zf-HC2 domain-containing protein [Anaerolineae bacterium]
MTMSLALDALLSPPEQQAFHQHLASCAQCRSRWLTWQQLDRMLMAAPLVGPAPGFVARVDQRLRRRQASRERLLGGLVLIGGTLLVWTLVVLSAAVAVALWLATNPTAQLHLAELLGFVGQLVALAVGNLLALRSGLAASAAAPLVTLFLSVLLVALAFLWLRLIPPRQTPSNS